MHGELAEGLVDGGPGVVEEDAAGLLGGEWADLVLEVLEFREHLGGKDVRPGGGHLSELYEGWPELLTDADESDADGCEGVGFWPLDVLAASKPVHRGQVAAKLEALDKMAKAVSGEDLGDHPQAGEGPDGLGQGGERHCGEALGYQPSAIRFQLRALGGCSRVGG